MTRTKPSKQTKKIVKSGLSLATGCLAGSVTVGIMADQDRSETGLKVMAFSLASLGVAICIMVIVAMVRDYRQPD